MHIQTVLQDLVAFQSITPLDAGCQDYIADYLTQLGFICTRYDSSPVSNLYAQWGESKPTLLFAGHTDVVAAGDLKAWSTPPFQLTEKNGQLYGRGVADMKGALAAMLVMATRLVKSNTKLNGSLGFLFTSGEEGDFYDLGTPYVMKKLNEQNLLPEYCVVGEPSCETKIGDTIKIGRRGSLHAHIQVHGKQGHVAYPHLADNPIHKASSALAALAQLALDNGNDFFPPSTLQITQIHAGFANNVIPEQLELKLNIRYSTEQTQDKLKTLIESCLKQHGVPPDIEWRLSGEPFLTSKGKLLETCQTVIEAETQHSPLYSTSGGTSDGRFIAPYGVEVIELGLCNGTIHQVDEAIGVNHLEELCSMYEKICLTLLS